MNFVDLPALADEYEELSEVAVPLTTERFALARTYVAEAAARLAAADHTLALAEAAMRTSEPGSDFDFLVRDLLALQRTLHNAQGLVTSSMQVLVRTNISLTAACTVAVAERGEESE